MREAIEQYVVCYRFDGELVTKRVLRQAERYLVAGLVACRARMDVGE